MFLDFHFFNLVGIFFSLVERADETYDDVYHPYMNVVGYITKMRRDTRIRRDVKHTFMTANCL